MNGVEIEAKEISLGAVSRREPMYIGDNVTYPMDYFSIPAHYKPFVKSLLLPHGMIIDRVEKLAADILEDNPTSTPHLLVVLKGASEFATDLTRSLRALHANRSMPSLPFTVDYIRVKSYSGTTSTGNVRIGGVDLKSIAGRDVIVVEDIIDTGLTMSKLIPILKDHGPSSVRVCSLLEKRTVHSCGFKGDYVGFSIPDDFVIGYNLDYNEAFREMSHMCIINEAGISHFKQHPILQGLL